jgi:hypothetical protein
MVDRVGERHGKLVVTRLIQLDPVKWECRCDCGKIVVLSKSSLWNRISPETSCGCTRLRPFEVLYNVLVYTSRCRNLVTKLTYEQFLKFTEIKLCCYCETKIAWDSNRRACNLDRKDNSEGYTESNCVVCCGTCNRVRGSAFSYEEMLLLGETVKTIRLKRGADIPYMVRQAGVGK